MRASPHAAIRLTKFRRFVSGNLLDAVCGRLARAATRGEATRCERVAACDPGAACGETVSSGCRFATSGREADREEHVLSSLRQVITAGEQLKITPHVARLFQRLSNSCTLDNHYGPTETHLATMWRQKATQALGKVA